MAPKWQTFGVHLKVPYPKVQGIKGCNSIVDGCFMDVLMEWTIRGATIDQLVFALRYPGVDHGRLASEIDKNRSGLWYNLNNTSGMLDSRRIFRIYIKACSL